MAMMKGHSHQGQKERFTLWGLAAGLAVILLAVGAACTSDGDESGTRTPATQTTQTPDVPESAIPDFILDAPARVQEAYNIALERPQVLEYIPCFCGCGAGGHQSNLDCFVKEIAADGTIDYDSHAFGCSICVDIALDAKQMHLNGVSLTEIRQFIDEKYGDAGPATDTSLPPTE